MKVCVLNFSGNVGKSTIAAHLLQPRLNAQVFSVESLNVDASSDGVEVARLRGKHYNDLLQRPAAWEWSRSGCAAGGPCSDDVTA